MDSTHVLSMIFYDRLRCGVKERVDPFQRPCCRRTPQQSQSMGQKRRCLHGWLVSSQAWQIFLGPVAQMRSRQQKKQESQQLVELLKPTPARQACTQTACKPTGMLTLQTQLREQRRLLCLQPLVV